MTTKVLTVGDCLDIRDAVMRLLHAKGPTWRPGFTYWLSCIERQTRGIQESVGAALAVETEENALREFDMRRVAVIRSHAKRDAQGNPILVEGNFQFDDESTSMEAAASSLRQEFPEIEALVIRRTERRDELRREPANLDLPKRRLEDFPEAYPEDVKEGVNILDRLFLLIDAPE